MSDIIKAVTFNPYENLISFDGTNILTCCITGDLYLQFLTYKKMGKAWLPAPHKNTPEDFCKENFNLTNVAFCKGTIVTIYNNKELWISRDNHINVENTTHKEKISSGTSKFNEWTKYDNNLMDDNEKYRIIRLFNEDFLLICTSINDDKIKSYLLDLNKMIFYDITYGKDTNEFNYDNRTYYIFYPNKDEHIIAHTIYNNILQTKHFNFGKIMSIAGSPYSKIMMIYKNDELLTIPYSKIFTNLDINVDSWTKLDIKFNDPKEFITSIGVSKSYYFVVTYKNIYAKKIEGENDWFTLPFFSKSSFDIKIVNGELYDVTNVFWTSIECYNNNVTVTNINGKVYMVILNDNSGVIIESLLPQIMVNDCYTNKILKQIVFKDKYTIEYSEFECNCKSKSEKKD